jgi:hypothetical protein
MNQTALSLQVDSFKNLIEAASTRSAVNRKPYTNGFKYIPTDNARTWETEKAVFRHFTVFLDAKERGAFIETAGSAGAKRYNWSTTIRLVFVYPLHAGDDALRLADISSADDMLVTSIIENPANRVTGVNACFVGPTVFTPVGQHNRIMTITVRIDTTEVI